MATRLPGRLRLTHIIRDLQTKLCPALGFLEASSRNLLLAGGCLQGRRRGSQAWSKGDVEELYYVDEPVDSKVGRRKGRSGVLGPASLKVHCFWDLDNKQLLRREEVERVVPHLRSALAALGRVQSIRAFGNKHCFDFLPHAEREAREERASRGSEEDGNVHRCGICGGKFPSVAKLTKHFKQLHERERNKRLDKITPQKYRKRWLESNTEKTVRYLETRNDLFNPKRGFGLKTKLQGAEIEVTRVPNQPQAADLALKGEVAHFLRGLEGSSDAQEHLVCIISDDRGFKDTFKKCRAQGCRTISISHDTTNFETCTDYILEWETLKAGLYEGLLDLRGHLS